MKYEIKSEINKLLPQMKKLSNMIAKAEDDWLDFFEENDPEDMYLRTMFYRISKPLDEARRIALQVDSIVIAEGKLYRNRQGRYEISQGSYFTTGDSIEYLREDGEGSVWVYTKVGHNGEDYYIMADPQLKLQGVMARKKHTPPWD